MLADSPVRVVFDRPVVPSSVAGRFTVSPGVPGCDLRAAFTAASTAPCWIHWLPGDSGFELLHEQAVFAPATRYEFALAGGFSDLRGDSNDLDHQWDLTSAAAPRVSGSTPSDGTVGVAVDSPVAVTFNSPMDPPTTAAAISLEPSVAGTRVIRNLTDRTRFIILPGRLLDPHTTYTISVGTAARGEDNQAIATAPPFAARFTTGARLAAPHAVVLAGVPGEAPTEVLAPALAPAAAGEPVAAPLLMRAGRCSVPPCGSVGAGAPLETYSAAAIAPDAAHVAVVVDSSGSSPPTSRLEVVDTVGGDVIAQFADATRPSWSPAGAALAFAAAGNVEVFDVVTGTVTTVAASTPLLAAPLWAGSSTLVLSAAADPSTAKPSTVELVDTQLGARYDLPAAPPGTAAAAISPSGDQLAVSTGQGVSVVIPVGGGTGGIQRPPGLLDPIGFADEGTLVALSHATTATQLVRVNVVGGDSTTITLGVDLADLATVRVAPDGRRLAFLALDDLGVLQAYVTNADGTGPQALTRFLAGDMQAQAIDFTS